jgi:tetratricopeptide (TPR) repeat protein
VDHLSIAADRSALAAILDAQGRHREALGPMSEALELLEAELGGDHYEVALLLTHLGAVAGRAGERAQAEASYERALDIQRRILGPDHANVRATRKRLVALRRDSRRAEPDG